MSERYLGCISFVMTPVPNNVCGSNGLPLTPNSIKALGLAQDLLALKHENLCRYVDFRCAKHDRVCAVTEYYLQSLNDKMSSSSTYPKAKWHEFCLQMTSGVLNGLFYLNRNDIIHLSLEPKNILLTADNKPKLCGYGLHHMTEGGKLVLNPLGIPKYSSPEQLIDLYLNKSLNSVISFKSDTWSLCIILFELLHRKFLWENKTNEEIITNVLKLCQCNSSKSVIQMLLFDCSDTLILNENSDILAKLNRVLENGLVIDQQYRMTPESLLSEISFDVDSQPVENGYNKIEFDSYNAENSIVNPLNDMDWDEIWYLWNLTGGDMMSYALKSVTTTSSIEKLPVFGSCIGEVFGEDCLPENLFDSTFTLLPMEILEKRLVVNEDNMNFIYPLLEMDDSTKEADETAKLPILIKENAFEYQVYRIALFKRLLSAYPYLRDQLWKEARIDIPPFCRGKVWAGLLDVTGNIEEQYLRLDKETPIITDRQIAVDIPRCHQYNAILSSPIAHCKLRRVLKAWIMAHPHLTYWQGLDSLCAVFLHLNFNEEHLAFACLSSFIEKYLHHFFLKDNSAVIQEYLVVFSHLIAFHDPELANHLNGICFFPDLYAIPWFLTMFAHVFPLDKVVHLWDTLLLGNSSFPLCIGVAILQQLRSQLIKSDFNECILLFSDLPEIDIDNVVRRSVSIFCQIPKSSTYRVHAQQEQKRKREVVSYYSDDYNSLPKNELSNMNISLSDLKEEICCRISAEDLIQLCELRGNNDSKTPAKQSKNSKPQICVVDVRPLEEFNRGAIPGSVNIHSAKSSSLMIQNIVTSNPKITVVVRNQSNRDDRNFAHDLIKNNLKGVCVLHGGIEILKPTGILIIPSQ